MLVKVDRGKCIGAGNCLVAPEVFDQDDDDGLVVLLSENATEQQLPDVREAARLCPAEAIYLEEE